MRKRGIRPRTGQGLAGPGAMIRSHYQIHAEVRRVFARHWVDLDRIQFGVYRDMLRVTGELLCSREASAPATAALLEVLQGELMRVPEIRCVQFDLRNWQRDTDGRWQQTNRATVAEPGTQSSSTVVHVAGPGGAKTN